jgi:nicotinate phosphoribosyltransferase
MEERAFGKAERLIRGGCTFSEFGSRRRRDYHTHDLVIQGLLSASKQLDGPGKLQGTSNVHFAMKYNLTPIGTVAHEVQAS